MYGSRVEILTLTDNKQRSIGAKRQALLNLAQGKYIAFLDDDDVPSHNYIERAVSLQMMGLIDVITFNQYVSINDEMYPLTFKLGHEAK